LAKKNQYIVERETEVRIVEYKMGVFSNIKKQCQTAGGYLEFLKIAIPLVISMSSGSIQLFINRTFLFKYSQDVFAASTPAGTANWTIITLFLGTLAYVDVFVSQYYGKKEYRSIGPVVWQSVYLSLIAGFIIFCISFFSEHIFMNLGHAYNVACEEVKFFRVLCYGAFPTLATAALSGFYAGRGKTKVVLLVGIFGVIVDIVLNYCLIFGNFGFPEMGIVGSAWAGNIASIITFITYIFLVTAKKNSIYNGRYIKPDFVLMKRLLRYGFPNGVQFFFDAIGFMIFISIVGMVGENELTAGNVVLNINQLIVMPLVGCGMAISVIVGNYLGSNEPSVAQMSVKSAAKIVYIYSIFVIFILIFLPDKIIQAFSYITQTSQSLLLIEQIKPLCIDLLRILGVYLIFDATGIIFSAVIKGAGDTVFIMLVLVLATVFFVFIPSYLIMIVFKLGVYLAWVAMLTYSITLAVSFYYRYKSNKWKNIRVIDIDII